MDKSLRWGNHRVISIQRKLSRPEIWIAMSVYVLVASFQISTFGIDSRSIVHYILCMICVIARI